LSPADTAALRLTGTRLAQFFRFRCERQLRYELVPPSERGGDVPAPNDDPARGPIVGVRAGTGLLTAAGRRFERRKLAALVGRFGREAVLTAGVTEEGDARPMPYGAVVETLRDPGTVRFLVQPQLLLPDPAAFARRYGIDSEAIGIAAAQPDLVRVGRGKDGRLRLGVIDVKWSRERAVHHFAQVAFYALLLEEIVRAEGIDAVVETRWGWVWSRGDRAPRRFAMAAYRHHVEAFLRDDLPRIAAMEPGAADWHLTPACGGCAFFHHCRAEADRTDDLARVPGLTPIARQVLHGRGIRSVAQLTKAGLRRDTYTGSYALESAGTTLRQRAQALSYRKTFEVEKHTHLAAAAERVRVIITAEGDPVSGTVFALGMRVERGSGGRVVSEAFVSPAGTRAGEGEMLGAFLARAAAAVGEMLAATEGGSGRRGEKPVHVFVYDRSELDRLRGMLQRHLSDGAAQPGIAALSGLLFPGRGTANLRHAPAAPGTVVLDAVAELFALPVPYALDLRAVSAALRPAERAALHAPAEDYAWPLSSQVAFERIHNVWRRRPHGAQGAEEVRAEIERTVLGKLAAIDSVVRAMREQASRGAAPRLRLDPGGPASGAAPQPIADAVLETLRIFTELEAAAESLAIRALHSLPSRERALRFESIRELEAVERIDQNRWIFSFDPDCREAKFRVGDFSLVLTNDDGEMLMEMDRKPWLRRKVMVELIGFDLSGDRPRLTLGSEHGFDRLESEGVLKFGRMLVLDRAEADFNTRRVVSTLRHLADGHGEAAFVRALLDGRIAEDWLLAPLDADHAWTDSVASAGARLGRAVLNAEQAAAWRAAFDRAATVVWGPPGTGKTYLLAWMLAGLAAGARRAARPMRILVSAATHRAIANVLVRLARELSGTGIDLPLRVVKLRGRGSEPDAELADAGVELVDDEKLEMVLRESDETGVPVVVGSTVWSLWKRMRAAGQDDEAPEMGDVPIHPLFDAVVIDEASQMKVAESLVALSSIRRGGRVILCGDDRQLAPVVRGSYDPAETLFGSAFGHFAARFGRVSLRESRRMSAPLVAYPRRIFYPGLVSTVPDQRLSISPAADLDLSDPLDALLWETFFRPEDAVLFCTYGGYRATAHNPFEARLAARIAWIARAGLADPATGERYTPERFRDRALAVLSPHRAQNSAVLSELRARGWAQDELPVVDTVERMQGNEREMIVVSYAVADREYAEREAEFLLNPNRFNVSITRARSKLVVLMSDEVLRTLPRDERVMTGSMAVKGYLRQPWREVRDIEIPAPDGTMVRLTCRVR